MPLSHGKSKEAVSQNIKTEMAAGKPQDQAVAIALNTAREAGAHIPKKAEGGFTAGNPADIDSAIKDATVNDFLLPYLLAPSGMMENAGQKLANEAGEITLGKMAPKMEGAAEEAAPKVEAFVKGIQKGPSGDVKIWGVRGDPAEVEKLGYGPDPGSIPEHVLQQKGLLPTPEVSIPEQESPTPYADGGFVDKIKKLFGSDKSDVQKALDVDPDYTPPPTNTAPPVASTDTAKGYAEGGKVERSSLEHPVPNAMMARAMDKGGYPHVTFLENESPATVNKVTHVEHAPHTPATSTETGAKDNPMHMAEGGKTPHFLEGLKKGTLHKELDISEDKKIPEKKLEHAANSDNETLRKRAQFAINAKKFHHAEGGIIPHEDKVKEVYKAMGIKKYADGGVTTSDGPVTGTGLPTPNPSDPTYWDQIKAALSKLSAPVTGAINAATAPLQAATSAAMPLVPPTVAAVNNLTGANLPVPSVPPVAPEATPPVTQAPTSAPMPSPAKLPATPVIPPATTPGMPNLNTIFNQDTSKLTAGVNPEDRQALANQLQEKQHSLGSVIAEAVAGLGDALAAKGGREQHSLQGIFGQQKEQRDEALANFDAARQERLQKVALQTQMGDNALKQAAAADAYGVDDHLNGLIGAPKGTMKKDLPTYFEMMSAGVAKQEKDADLYMKAHAQAASDIDNAVKNSSVLGIKPSPAQLQASGAKLADQYFNRAKGNILVKPSDGGVAQWIPAQNLAKAKQMDPNLQIQP